MHQGVKTSPLAATLKGLNNKTNHEHLEYPKNNNCLLYPINGIEEHLHRVTQLQPSVARAALVKNIKLGSATLMKHGGLFPNFNGGQHGYGAFPYAIKEKARRIE